MKDEIAVAPTRHHHTFSLTTSRALKQTNNNVTHAARLLKISRKGLQLKMKELGLREGSGEKSD